MNRPITNKDDLEILIDELGLKTVLAIIATICQEKADKAKVSNGYYSDPCKKFMQAGANIRTILTPFPPEEYLFPDGLTSDRSFPHSQTY